MATEGKPLSEPTQPTQPMRGSGGPEREDDTDTGFTSLEHHLFGARYEEVPAGSDELTQLHGTPAEAATIVQQSGPAGNQVIVVLPAGERLSPERVAEVARGSRALPPPPSRPRPSGWLAGGVFAGVSAVAGASVLALGLVCAVLIGFTLSRPPPPVIVAVPPLEVAPVTTATPAAEPPVAEPPEPSPLAEGVVFPARFAFNDWRPLELDDAAFAEIVTDLGGCPGVVVITGHTDQRGSDTTNDRFALARASEVRALLVARGIARSRIEITSAGAGANDADAPPRRVTIRCGS